MRKIKETANILLVAGIILAIFSGVAMAVDVPIGEYKGVIAYSNGVNTGTGIGPKQCTEYVKRFYTTLMDTSHWSGLNANDYYEHAVERDLVAYPNGGSMPPQPDDILTFTGSLYGHVAIITEVGSSYVKVIEQNVEIDHAIHQLLYDQATNKIGDANGHVPLLGTAYTVQGWLRKPPGIWNFNIPGNSEGWFANNV